MRRRALILARELRRRRQRDRLSAYRPYAKQRAFHDAGAGYRERLFMAGNQLGKTVAGSFEWGKLCQPAFGALCILDRAGGGHVFFVTRISERHIWGIGGNQADQVCEAKFDRARAIGFRWPAAYPLPQPLVEAGDAAGPVSGNER